MQRPALIVDDNDTYAKMLLSHLEPLGFRFDRAESASEGLEALKQQGPSHYSFVVTDITMEGQTAGLKLIRRIRRHGYKGVLMVASTGFNSPFILHLCRPFLALWGVDLLVPKEPLKAGHFRNVAISEAGRSFQRNDMHQSGSARTYC